MKMRILLSLAVLAMAMVATTRAELIHHYTLDANADDSVGATVYKHGYTYGAVYGPGILGGAAVFDGIDDHVDFRFERLVRTTEFTIAAWANHFGPGGGTEHVNQIFSQRELARGDDHSLISLHTYATVEHPTPYAGAAIRSTDGTVQTLATPVQPYNEWHHYAITVSPDYFIMYIDGVEVARAANLQSGDYVTNIGVLALGTSSDDLGRTRYFYGAIDDVRVYDNALSQAEVMALVPEPATVLLLGAGLCLLRRRR